MARSSRENKSKTQDIQQIPKWTRAYAMNRRAILVGLYMAVFLVLSAVIGGFSHLTGIAYRAGDTVLCWIYGIPALLAGAAVVFGSIYFSVPKWGGKKMDQFEERLAGMEGVAKLSSPVGRPKHVWVMWMVGILYGSCILASVYLGGRGFIPIAYMQPVSALYVVPFLLFLGCKLYPVAGPIPLLWPFLYALHAVLILAGIPILFTGEWVGLNMWIPIAGYGLLTAMAGYFYSRYALRRLRRLARIEETGANTDSEARDVE